MRHVSHRKMNPSINLALCRWLQEDSAKPSQPLNTSIVQRLQRFGT